MESPGERRDQGWTQQRGHVQVEKVPRRPRKRLVLMQPLLLLQEGLVSCSGLTTPLGAVPEVACVG